MSTGTDIEAPPLERMHTIRLDTGAPMRLAFRMRPGSELVTVHLPDASSRQVCEVRNAASVRPGIVFMPGWSSSLSYRCNRIRALAGALYRLGAEPERVSFLPRPPGPGSAWFDVRGQAMAFTPNVPACWVTLYAIEEDAPVFVGQVARISGRWGSPVLHLGEGWQSRFDTATGGLLVAAAVHVWEAARAVRTEGVRAA